MGSLQVRAGCLRKHQRGRTFVMQLTTVREIYKNRETFLDKEITVGDGYEAYVTQNIWIYRSA